MIIVITFATTFAIGNRHLDDRLLVRVLVHHVDRRPPAAQPMTPQQDQDRPPVQNFMVAPSAPAQSFMVAPSSTLFSIDAGLDADVAAAAENIFG